MTLGQYRILGHIGSGGMGEVYEAHDSKLERNVALKILPAHLVADEERLRRFVQEAKSVSGLSHPHIITVHEIGSAQPSPGDGSGEMAQTHYIAMELIDGETLRQKIYAVPQDLRSVLAVLAQAADGLAKAHAAGIVHRDLKPDNIMVTREGYAKVLDFGLAKLIEPKMLTGTTNAPTAVREATHEGVVLGTLGYMSPEQVQGKAVDHRSDIFSFGCILYEAVARRKAFEAESSIDILHKIVHSEPVAVSDINPQAPAELRRMIRRCLAKDPERRYQSMKDLAIELRDLADEFDQLSPGSGSNPAQTILPPPFRSRVSMLITLAVVAIALSVLGWWIVSKQNAESNEKGKTFSDMKLTNLTTHGKASTATISPDGRYVVYVKEASGGKSIFLRQTATASEVQILPPTDKLLSIYFTFSRDGNYLYSVSREKGSSLGKLSVVPTLGGSPRHLIDDVDTPVTLSPDEKHLAFARFSPAKRETALIVAGVDGTNERALVIRREPEFFARRGAAPSWSPDGKSVAVISGTWKGGVNHNITLASVDGKSARNLIPRWWFEFRHLAWLPDGSGVVALGQEVESGLDQLWIVSVPRGETRRVTNDLNSYSGVSVTADGKSLASVQEEALINLQIYSTEDLTRGRGVTNPAERNSFDDFEVGPDGSAWFSSIASGNFDVWRVTSSGERKQITTNAKADFEPVPAHDGRSIFFQTERAGSAQLWSMNADGSGEKFLIDLQENVQGFDVSPDDRWVVYSIQNALWALPAGGGRPRKLGDFLAVIPQYSPDGKWIGGLFRLGVEPNPYRVAVIPSDGGSVRSISMPSPTMARPFLRWTPDGSGLAYINLVDGVSNIWIQPIDGSAAKQLTHFDSEEIFDFSWTDDGKQLYLTRGSTRGDVVLITDFR